MSRHNSRVRCTWCNKMFLSLPDAKRHEAAKHPYNMPPSDDDIARIKAVKMTAAREGRSHRSVWRELEGCK